MKARNVVLVLVMACLQLLGQVTSHGKSHIVSDPDLDDTWETFKQHHRKSYRSKEYEFERRLIFEDHLQLISEHNLQADLGQHTYTLGLTPFTDWTHDEFQKFINLFQPTNRTDQGSPPDHVKMVTSSLPDTVNWVTQGAVTGVKNQGQCGGCYTFSATGALEGQQFLNSGQLISLSEQNLLDCSQSLGNQGCNGGAIQYAFQYVQQAGGIDTEASYPYTGKAGSCQYVSGNSAATCSGWINLPSGDETTLQQTVATIGPVSVAIDASGIQHYRSGVYSSSSCSSTNLDHAVLVVGYGTSSSGQQFWQVKNSWGTSWGMNGYIEIARNHNNMCGIATAALYPTV